MENQGDPGKFVMPFVGGSQLTDRPETIMCNCGRSYCSNCVGQNRTTKDTGSDVPEISIQSVKRAAEPFARGGCAKVYKAEWQKQSVALKVLRRQVVETNEQQDLLQEARLAMSLNHPNVVRVFGVVSIDERKGLLMEKADRGSLRSALNETNKLSLDQLVSISIDIVDGLDYIHSKQMVHRDLKPENVLLFDIKSQLTAKITDFGISKVVRSSLAATTNIGTPYYMAPELFKADVRYGWEVDVYSLAIVLYEVFSGRHIQDAYPRIQNLIQFGENLKRGMRPKIPESFPADLRTVVELGWSAVANSRPTLADFRGALCKLSPSARNAIPRVSASANAGASTSRSTNADAYAAFEAQLHKLELSTKAYKLVDAKSQVEACQRLWIRLGNSTAATASSARFYSVNGYLNHWFGECSDAYKETYRALTELYELYVSGRSVEGEEVVTILRYAVDVCWSQDQYAAAVVLVRYAIRYAKSKLSAAACADALECFCCLRYRGGKWIKIAKFLLSTRLKASADKPHINVAAAHYCLAENLYADLDSDFSAAQEQLKTAQQVINEVDVGNIWAAACISLKGNITFSNEIDLGKLEETKQRLEVALKIAERVLGEGNKTVAEINLSIALTLRKMRKFAESERIFKKAIEAAENSLGPNCSLVAWIMINLADMYKNELRKNQEAEVLYVRSVEIYKSLYGPGYSNLSSLYESLAEISTERRQTAKAETYRQLKLQVERGELEDRYKSTEEALTMLVDEVLRIFDSEDVVSESPDEFVAVLRNFFDVAPKPKLQPQPLQQNSAKKADEMCYFIQNSNFIIN